LSVEIIFETHSTSVDNENGIASGWRDIPLSATGREQAKELGERRRHERIDAVFCSDLRRAVETAEIAFGGRVDTYPDHRLREYDYGTMTGAPSVRIRKELARRVDEAFPEGESLRDVVERMRPFVSELASTWDGKRVVVIGHIGTRLALDHLVGGLSLEEAASAPFEWQPGWEYVIRP